MSGSKTTTTKQETIGLGMIGFGTVGRGVAMLLRDQAVAYADRVGKAVVLRCVVVRDVAKARGAAAELGLVGVGGAGGVGGLDPAIFTTDVNAMIDSDEVDVVIEVAGGLGVRESVERALSRGKSVVTANKSLLASAGSALFDHARRHDAAIGFEASCGGGIPIITSLLFGLGANRIEAMVGILNGTCNYILTAMTQRGQTYEAALAEAQQKGFAEADPAMDISGRDSAEKLAILASLAYGVQVDANAIACEGIDHLDMENIRLAAEMGYGIKLLAIAQRYHDGGGDGGADEVSLRVEPCFVDRAMALSDVHGSYNALSIDGHATGVTTYVGHGAGQMPTASAVVSDVLNVASGWYGQAFSRVGALSAGENGSVRVTDRLVGRFFIRLNMVDTPGAMACVAQVFGDAGISLSSVLQHEASAGQVVPVVVTTHETERKDVDGALIKIEGLRVIAGRAVCVRVLDLDEG